jgi:hypothetical protein
MQVKSRRDNELEAITPTSARVAARLPSLNAEAVKTTALLSRERFDATGLLWAALAGELFAFAFLLTSGGVSAGLVRSLQLFLRF